MQTFGEYVRIKRNKGWWWLLVGAITVVALCCCCGGLYLVGSGGV